VSNEEADLNHLLGIADLYSESVEREKAVEAIPIYPSLARARRRATRTGEPLAWDASTWGVNSTERGVLRVMVRDAVSDCGYYLAYGDRKVLCDALGMYPNTIVRAINGLVARGFLVPIEESKNGNGVLYRINLRDLAREDPTC